MNILLHKSINYFISSYSLIYLATKLTLIPLTSSISYRISIDMAISGALLYIVSGALLSLAIHNLTLWQHANNL